MDLLSVLDLTARGIAGGLLVVLVTYLADRYGAKVGGLLSAFPTVTSISLIIIAINQGPTFTADAALSTSIGLVATLVFAVGFFFGYRLDSGRRVTRTVVATIVGFLTYFAFVFVYLALFDEAHVANFLVLIVGVVIGHYLLQARIPSSRDDAQDRVVDSFEYAIKAAFGAAIVILATVLADVLGPMFGGVFAAFPATVAPILIIVSLTQSPPFLYRMISFTPIALLGTGAFVVGVWAGFPRYGIAIGTILGYVLYGLLIFVLGSLEGRAVPFDLSSG